jgi:mono/diheme cytochrome c family protein
MRKTFVGSLLIFTACAGSGTATPAGDTGITDTIGSGDVTPDTTLDTLPDTALDTMPTDTAPTIIPDGPAGALPPLGTTPRGYSGTAPAGQVGEPCRTATWWVNGTSGNAVMVPGGDCIQCHRQQGGPSYAIAGTIMGDYDNAENCRGVPTALVEIIGSDGVVTRLTSNSAGNFYLSARGSRVVMPFTARVTLNGQTYAMETETSNGSCNSCHIPGGNGDTAGRIVAP